VSVGKSKSLRVNTIVLFVCQNSRMKFWGGGAVWEPELLFYLA
jgi:hypothetical protein